MQTTIENVSIIFKWILEPIFWLIDLMFLFILSLVEAILWILNDVWPFVLLFILLFGGIKLMDSFGYSARPMNLEPKKEIKEDFKDPQLLCPNCEHDILASEDFCYTCGYDLNIQKEKEVIEENVYRTKKGQMLESMSSSGSYDEFLKKEETVEGIIGGYSTKEYLEIQSLVRKTRENDTLAKMLEGLVLTKRERFTHAFSEVFPFLLIIGMYVGMAWLILQ